MVISFVEAIGQPSVNVLGFGRLHRLFWSLDVWRGVVIDWPEVFSLLFVCFLPTLETLSHIVLRQDVLIVTMLLSS